MLSRFTGTYSSDGVLPAKALVVRSGSAAPTASPHSAEE